MLAGKRGPIVAGVGAAVLVLLLVFFLVLPKMSQVTEAQDTLAAAESEQTSLESQLQALQQAEIEAPEARKTIEDVDRKIPLIADLPGMILQLNGAATQASVSLLTITPATPGGGPDHRAVVDQRVGHGRGELLRDHRVPVQHRDAAAGCEGADLEPVARGRATPSRRCRR